MYSEGEIGYFLFCERSCIKEIGPFFHAYSIIHMSARAHILILLVRKTASFNVRSPMASLVSHVICQFESVALLFWSKIESFFSEKMNLSSQYSH